MTTADGKLNKVNDNVGHRDLPPHLIAFIIDEAKDKSLFFFSDKKIVLAQIAMTDTRTMQFTYEAASLLQEPPLSEKLIAA